MPPSEHRCGFRIWAISPAAVGFGLLTIKEGGTVLFGDAAAHAAAGNYVPFVLWFNPDCPFDGRASARRPIAHVGAVRMIAASTQRA